MECGEEIKLDQVNLDAGEFANFHFHINVIAALSVPVKCLQLTMEIFSIEIHQNVNWHSPLLFLLYLFFVVMESEKNVHIYQLFTFSSVLRLWVSFFVCEK